MPSFDSGRMDPTVIAAELDAIDATLAGEPVDPAHAELAELALLLADTAPRPTPEFASDLDRRVARRFASVAAAGGADGTPRTGRGRLGGRRFSLWTVGPAVALVAAAAAVVVVIGNGGFGGGSSSTVLQVGTSLNGSSGASTGVVHGNGATSLVAPVTTSTTASGASGSARSSVGSSSPAAKSVTSTYGASTSASDGSLGSLATAPTPLPGTTGKVIQSASISLSTANDHVDQVSQEVYNVVGLDGGTVTNSQITAATQSNGGGYASFTLSFPTANLQAAMTALSRLRYASVASRTDGTQNVGGQYNTDQQNLQQAQALRTSLLKQLAAAASQTSIDAIEAQLKTADAQLASAQSALNSLRHKISYSDVTVQINTGGVIINPVTPITTKHGFTISRAGHDAVRVLVVSLGIGLITLAVLVPLSLVVALLAWVTMITRRRRREQALDAG